MGLAGDPGFAGLRVDWGSESFRVCSGFVGCRRFRVDCVSLPTIGEHEPGRSYQSCFHFVERRYKGPQAVGIGMLNPKHLG